MQKDGYDTIQCKWNICRTIQELDGCQLSLQSVDGCNGETAGPSSTDAHSRRTGRFPQQSTKDWIDCGQQLRRTFRIDMDQDAIGYEVGMNGM